MSEHLEQLKCINNHLEETRQMMNDELQRMSLITLKLSTPSSPFP